MIDIVVVDVLGLNVDSLVFSLLFPLMREEFLLF
jgi:hypothetical protein